MIVSTSHVSKLITARNTLLSSDMDKIVSAKKLAHAEAFSSASDDESDDEKDSYDEDGEDEEEDSNEDDSEGNVEHDPGATSSVPTGVEDAVSECRCYGLTTL